MGTPWKVSDETFSLIFKPSVVAIVFYFGIPFGVVFPSCQSYLIFCFAVSSLRGLLTHLLQRIGSRHIDLLLKFWVATEPRGSGNIGDFLQSCSRLTDTKKKFPMTWCMKIIYVSSSNQKSAAFFGLLSAFLSSFLICGRNRTGGKCLLGISYAEKIRLKRGRE